MKNNCIKLFGFSALIVAFAGLTAFAGPTVQNGDFSTPGLSGWTVEYGTVTDGGGYALFEEDPFDLSSTLSQGFTIPTLALELSFDVVMSAVPGGAFDPFAWADTFTASLYDSGDNPLFANPLGIDEFFYLDNTGFVDTTGTITGNTVSLDVSSLVGQDVLLVFDLWGGDDGWLTSVSLDNVNVSVIPAPGALLLAGIGTALVGFLRRSRIAKIG